MWFLVIHKSLHMTFGDTVFFHVEYRFLYYITVHISLEYFTVEEIKWLLQIIMISYKFVAFLLILIQIIKYVMKNAATHTLLSCNLKQNRIVMHFN